MHQLEASFLSQLGTSDFDSWILVQQAYRSFAYNEEIMTSGFNQWTGFVYIALENGVTICSCFGQDVEYLITDRDGEETFYNSYAEAYQTI